MCSYCACGLRYRYWADIDTQLRRVAYEKRVKVRLLISCWASTQPVMFPFLKSLASVQDPKSKLDIEVVCRLCFIYLEYEEEAIFLIIQQIAQQN